MYSNRKYFFVFFSLVILGIVPRVFAVDVSKTLLQASQESADASSLFAGKSQVSNLYAKSLHLAKQNEIVSTQHSLDQVVAYYNALSCTVTAKDVLYVLYNSDQGFRTFFTQVIIRELVPGSQVPSQEDITKSYYRFFACGKKSIAPTAQDFTNLQTQISDLYYQNLTTTFLDTTMNQDNFGEDLFRNGSTSDSDFDLLKDINTLGDTFFSTFSAAPEILFYSMPTSSSLGSQGGSQGGNGGGGNGGNLPPSTGSTGGQQAPLFIGNNSFSQNSIQPSADIQNFSQGNSVLGNAILGSTSSLLHSTQIADPDVQQFLATTDPSTYVQSDLNFVVGSQCTSGAKPLPAPQTSSGSSISDEAYISGLESFIENANIKDVINAGLISGFAAHYQTIAQQVAHASLGGIGVNSPESQTADAVANTYAEQAFGLGDSQCDASCAGMSLGAQMQCQLGCARSCISQCAGLGATDKALCIVNCSCFMVSGPIGSGGAWNQIENMFSIKFCKAPVSTTDAAGTTLISLETNSPGKVVSSLEGIFDEIAGILEGLKNSGKTVKYVKPKEFLDPSIKLKFADILDFKILVDFKPIFPKRTVTPTPVTTATDSSSENYNKYVVISDVAKNKAELQPYATQAELDTDVQDMQDVADLTQSSPSSSAITVAQNGKFALLSEDIMDFLTSHQAFWNQLSTSLESLLEDTIVLKGKIENSD